MERPSGHAVASRGFAGEVRRHGARIFRFGIVSGIGLGLDLLTFALLIQADLSPFHANAVSSVAGVSFVYFASVRRIFSYDGRFHVPMFAGYLLYHMCGIAAGSWLVAWLTASGLIPFAAKLCILPLTFGANYLFMGWLTTGPLARSARS